MSEETKFASTTSLEVDPPTSEIMPGKQQDIAVVSIRCRKEPMKLPDGKNLSGLFKVRFVGTADECDEYTMKMIDKSPSHHRYDFMHMPIGKFALFTDSEKFVQKMKAVAAPEDANSIHTSVAKDVRAQELKAGREAQQRLEDARKGPAVHDDPESLDFEVYKRVTFIRLSEAILAAERKLEELKKKIVPVHSLLKQMDKRFPERCPEGNSMSSGVWLERYNEERRRSGIRDYIPGRLIDDMYAKFTGEVGDFDVDYLRKNPILPGDVADTVIRAPVLGSIPGTAAVGAVPDEEITIASVEGEKRK